eukprot:TRINITY_DN9397_c0_g1::TRINITY_DN9397_c0_g1_i1::g.28389::m.28389 TRINITY_DN9397_c0_g1::TRINITY_DN9397_c0_g1_i1::g.28389  ORF type:complete len:217 (+),score=8.84 TRINITY_DN9397_c0_g1_i1:121-771(+)
MHGTCQMIETTETSEISESHESIEILEGNLDTEIMLAREPNECSLSITITISHILMHIPAISHAPIIELDLRIVSIEETVLILIAHHIIRITHFPIIEIPPIEIRMEIIAITITVSIIIPSAQDTLMRPIPTTHIYIHPEITDMTIHSKPQIEITQTMIGSNHLQTLLIPKNQSNQNHEVSVPIRNDRKEEIIVVMFVRTSVLDRLNRFSQRFLFF